MKTSFFACLATIIFFSACRTDVFVAGPPEPNGITDPQFFFSGNISGQPVDIKGGVGQYSTLSYTDGLGLPIYSGPDEQNLQTASKFDFVSLQIVPGYEVNVYLGVPHRDSITAKQYPIAWPGILDTNFSASKGKAAVRIVDMSNLVTIKTLYSYAIANYHTPDMLTVTRVEDYFFNGVRLKKVHFTIDCNLYEDFNQTYPGMPFKRLTASGVMAF